VSRSHRDGPGPLTVIGTHPVQYQAPVYAAVEQQFGIPVRAIYRSDYSIAGGYDKEFQTPVTWDNFAIDAKTTTFLSTTRAGAEQPQVGLGEALRQAAPGAVLLTGYQPGFLLRAFFEAKRRNYKVLFRAETTDRALERSAAKSWLRDQFLRNLYRRCDRLLPIGSHSRDHYRRLGCPESRLIAAPYCVDTRVFQCEEHSRDKPREAKRRELGIAEGQIALLFSGKLGTRKAPDLLVEAAKRLPGELRKKVILVFLGSGPLEEHLSQLAEGEPSIQTHFVGFKNQSQLSPYYHSADLMVLPSYSETWGLVVNEALHHGVPCVVTEAVGCAADLIDAGVTGEVAKTGDADSLAAAIGRAINLSGDPAIRAKCREKIGGFTVERAAEGIAKAYWSVTQNGVG
jgi:glycosyltransferase involved in cell wall biosynthesis